jgi:hypothetical protein
MTLDSLLAIFAAYWQDVRTNAIVTGILLDLITAVMVALKFREFNFRRLADFMGTNVIPYLFGNLAFWFLGYVHLNNAADPDAWATGITLVSSAAIGTALTADIISHLREFAKTPEQHAAEKVTVTTGVVTTEDKLAAVDRSLQ